MKTIHRLLTRFLLILAILGACEPARAFYDPRQGRWLNRDPIGELGGLNVYEFCANDAIDYVDGRGLSIWSGFSTAWDWWFHPPYTGPNYLTPGQTLRYGPPPANVADAAENLGEKDIPSAVTGRRDQMRSGGDDALNLQDQFAREGVNVGLGAAIPEEKAGEMAGDLVEKLLGKCRIWKNPPKIVPTYTKTFDGMEARAVRDLDHVDDETLKAMAEHGFASKTINGEPIVLHHHRQNPAGFVVEMPAGNHSIGNRRQHPFGNTPASGLSEEQREAFNRWRENYWKMRAQEELDRRGIK